MKISKPFLIFLIFVCSYMFVIGISPVKVEIIPTKTDTQAYIHRRSVLPPFNDVGDFIPNLKQAVVAQSEESGAKIKYRVELVDFQGNHYPVTLDFSPVQSPEKRLQDNINNAIRNRNYYTYKTYPYFLLIFVAFPLTIFPVILKMKYYEKRYKQYKKKSEQTKKSNQSNTKLPESDKQKYNKINNSIIK